MSIRLEDGPRLEDVTNLYGASYESSVLQTAFLIILASSPALKSGVTTDDALQAFFIMFFPSRQKQDMSFCNSLFCCSSHSDAAHRISINIVVIECLRPRFFCFASPSDTCFTENSKKSQKSQLF